ncbi:hypothetical protein [Bradyrhizobium cosmicum]|uniref:hypothetical protein n=1 Tax=Bradyrhizobium cosmicum TaxID=1404864 RepID=UPI0028E88484|nr:hypothetical protein [Bradyrhizobium cosmicum]
MGDEEFPETDIRPRVHTGTVNCATVLTVPATIALNQEIGAATKQARLRYLRDYWLRRVGAFKDIEILTPDKAGSYDEADNDAIVAKLRDSYKVLSVRRAGVVKGNASA